MAQPRTSTLTHSTVKRCPKVVASRARARSWCSSGHQANTLACGRLRWGSCLDTVAVHCDTRSEQVIPCLRYLLQMTNIVEHSRSCSFFLPRGSPSKKPTRVSRGGEAAH